MWCLADLISKLVYNFDIYCGKNRDGTRNGDENVEPICIPRGESRLAHDVVMKLIEGNHGKGHCIVMDNYFISIGLFEELANFGTYATGTVWIIRVGLPVDFKNVKEFNKLPQGFLDWRMHESCGISSVIWKDKKAVVLLSTHALSIEFPCMPVTTVPRRNGAIKENVPSTLQSSSS